MSGGTEHRAEQGAHDKAVEQQPQEVGADEEEAEQQCQEQADQQALSSAGEGGTAGREAPRHLLHVAQTRPDDGGALDGEARV